MEVAHRQSSSSSAWFLVELEFGNVGFWGERKTRVPGEKPLGAKERTNNKLNPHMASMPGFEPGPRWLEASALTTAPSLAPHRGYKRWSRWECNHITVSWIISLYASLVWSFWKLRSMARQSHSLNCNGDFHVRETACSGECFLTVLPYSSQLSHSWASALTFWTLYYLSLNIKKEGVYINKINPFAPGDFAEKRVLKLVDWFSGHCCAIKS